MSGDVAPPSRPQRAGMTLSLGLLSTRVEGAFNEVAAGVHASGSTAAWCIRPDVQ
jgi:hypothetical protein